MKWLFLIGKLLWALLKLFMYIGGYSLYASARLSAVLLEALSEILKILLTKRL